MSPGSAQHCNSLSGIEPLYNKKTGVKRSLRACPSFQNQEEAVICEKNERKTNGFCAFRKWKALGFSQLNTLRCNGRKKQ